MNTPEVINLIYPAGYTSADWTKASNGDISMVMYPQAAGSSNTKKYIGNYSNIVRGANEDPIKLGYVDEVLDKWTISFTSSSAPVVGDGYMFQINQLDPVTLRPKSWQPMLTILGTDTTWTIVATRLKNQLVAEEATNGFTTTSSAAVVTVEAKAGAGLMQVFSQLSPDTTVIANSVAGVLQRWGVAQLNANGVKNTPDNSAPTENYYDLVSFVIGVPQASVLGQVVQKLIRYNVYFSNPAKTSGGVVASTVDFYTNIVS